MSLWEASGVCASRGIEPVLIHVGTHLHVQDEKAILGVLGVDVAGFRASEMPRCHRCREMLGLLVKRLPRDSLRP